MRPVTKFRQSIATTAWLKRSMVSITITVAATAANPGWRDHALCRAHSRAGSRHRRRDFRRSSADAPYERLGTRWCRAHHQPLKVGAVLLFHKLDRKTLWQESDHAADADADRKRHSDAGLDVRRHGNPGDGHVDDETTLRAAVSEGEHGMWAGRDDPGVQPAVRDNGISLLLFEPCELA